MNLKQELRDALAGMSLFSSGKEVVELAATGQPPGTEQSLRVELTALDRLGCAFERLSLTSDAVKGASIERLKATATKLSSQLTYLLEPISPIEIDSHGCVVQMRSNPPQKEADVTTYYELLVEHSGELSLCRYSRQAKGERVKIAAEVTREVLVRLVGDMSTASA